MGRLPLTEDLSFLVAHLTTAEIAQLLCTSPATVFRWTVGTRKPHRKYQQRIAFLVGIIKRVQDGAAGNALAEAFEKAKQ